MKEVPVPWYLIYDHINKYLPSAFWCFSDSSWLDLNERKENSKIYWIYLSNTDVV